MFAIYLVLLVWLVVAIYFVCLNSFFVNCSNSHILQLINIVYFYVSAGLYLLCAYILRLFYLACDRLLCLAYGCYMLCLP